MTVIAETTAFATSLLHNYGLVALFFVLVLEGAMLLYFAPSESIVPAAVVLLANSLLDVVVIVVVAVGGATVGQYALFLLAKRGGRSYLLEARWIRMGESTIDRVDRWFERWGLILVPLSNTLPFTRGMVTIPAGLAAMRGRTFVVLSATGSLAFQTILAVTTLVAIDFLPL